jgi:hypothetical protein
MDLGTLEHIEEERQLLVRVVHGMVVRALISDHARATSEQRYDRAPVKEEGIGIKKQQSIADCTLGTLMACPGFTSPPSIQREGGSNGRAETLCNLRCIIRGAVVNDQDLCGL